MKKSLLLTFLLAGAASVFGQGAIVWGNSPPGFRAPIYGLDPSDSSHALSGQSALGTPTGNTVYAGPLLQGSGWTFGLYFGAPGAQASTLTLLTSTTFRTAAGNALPAGLVTGGTVTVPGFAAGTSIEFQIRVWDNTAGATWDTTSFRGASALINSAALGGIDSGGNPVSTPATTGWSSFNVVQIPEPTSFALAGLGAAALMIFRRRK